MPEHYSAKQLARTKGLYDNVREWAETRGDVSIIGGWAVYEHVESGFAMQSRDVDIVLHTEDAFLDLCKQMPDWDLVWRTKGRKRFPDAHFKDEDPLHFRLDAFAAKAWGAWNKAFGRYGAGNIKTCPQALIPSLDWVIADKLQTVHKRTGSEGSDKRAKDMIDVYNLVFYNVDGIMPDALAQGLGGLRAKAQDKALEASKTRPEYAEQMETLSEWARS